MATISSLGTGSGLDLNTLLTNLMTAEKTPLLALQKKEASYQANISSFGSLQGALSSLQTAVSSMTLPTGVTGSTKFSPASVSVADSSIATAKSSTTIAAASYSLSVDTLAQAQRLGSTAHTVVGTAATTPISGLGDLKIEFGTLSSGSYTPDNTRTKTITINSSNNTLGGLRDAINASGADVTASIVVGSAGAQMVLTGKQTGLSSIMKISAPAPSTVTGFDYDPASGTGSLSEAANKGGQAASNAAFSINGIAGSSTSNTVTDMIEGVTLTLNKTTAALTPTTITVSKDTTTSLTAALTGFVKAYNDAAQTMSSLGAYNTTTKTAGALQGDSSLRGAQNQVRNQLFNITPGGSSSYQHLSDIGVTLGKDGKLSLDTGKLSTAIAADFTGVTNLVTATGSAFQTTLTGLVGEKGSVPAAVSGINSLITDNKASQTKFSARLTSIEAHYRAQFTALDTSIASLKSTGTYLTQQLANLPGFTSKNN